MLRLILFLFYPIQLSLPSDVVSLTFNREKILSSGVNEFAVSEHLSQLVKDVKALQVIRLFLFVLWVSSFNFNQEVLLLPLLGVLQIHCSVTLR